MRTLQKISWFGIVAIFLFTVSGFCRLPMVMAATIHNNSMPDMGQLPMSPASSESDMGAYTVTMDHETATPKHVTTCSTGCGQSQPVALVKKIKGYGELPVLALPFQFSQTPFFDDWNLKLAPPGHLSASEAILTVAKKE